jgi:peptidoglycan hydrolase-like protein with peptidoglycan-binding domain
MQKGQIIFWGLVSAIVAGGSYLIYKKLKDSDPSGKGGSSAEDLFNNAGTGTGGVGTVGSGETTTKTKIPSTPYPLKVGSVGRSVVILQGWLAFKGESIDVDGRFGQQTANAVSKYLSSDCVTVMGKIVRCEISSKKMDELVLKDTKTEKFKNFFKKYYPIINQYS